MLCIKRALPRLVGHSSALSHVVRIEPVQRRAGFLSMTLSALYPPPAEIVKHAHINSKEQYEKLYKQSLEDPDTFWSEQAEAFHWTKRWSLPVLQYVVPHETAKLSQSALSQINHAMLRTKLFQGITVRNIPFTP